MFGLFHYIARQPFTGEVTAYIHARELSCSCCPIAGLVDGLNEQIDLIREHQWDVAWINHVHETFRMASGSAANRQRTLAQSSQPLKLSRAAPAASQPNRNKPLGCRA